MTELPTTIRGQRDLTIEAALSMHSMMFERPNGDARDWQINAVVYGFIAAYSLAVIARYCPHDIAELYAEDLARALEAGDSMGEWLHQWNTNLDSGLGDIGRMPFEPICEQTGPTG